MTQRADFNDPNTYENRGPRSLPDVHPSSVTLYRHIATNDCFQVQMTLDLYRQSYWAAIPEAPPGPWLPLMP
jgi:hypothetical protein